MIYSELRLSKYRLLITIIFLTLCSLVASCQITKVDSGFLITRDYAEFIADNGDFQSSVSPINITVNDSASRPTVAVITVTTQINTPAEVTLLGTDPNSLPLTYHIVTEPVNGILSLLNDIYTYTPNADFVGSDSFTYNVSNGTLSSLNASVEIFIQGA